MNDTTKIIQRLKKETNNLPDIIYREKKIKNKKLYIIYNEPLTSSDKISDFIIRSLNNIKNVSDIKNSISNFKWVDVNSFEDLCTFLHAGFTIILIDGEKSHLALETKASINRSIAPPDTEFALRGSKDSFTEEYQINIGLIKKRIKNNNLWIENFKIGEYTSTNMGILYINGLADKELVNYITERIKNLKVNEILSSDYLKNLIEKENKNTLPTILTSQRPDVVSKALLEGKIAIVVDNSPYVLIIPTFFNDFFKTIEDDYGKSINVTLTRIIKYIAFLITILTPGFYIAITTYNQEMIPTDLLVSFATQRDGVPFPALIEALMMLLSFEILREGDLRIPNSAGSALSIVGALILGDAAVAAGIVSPIMIIVVAITSISSLLFSEPDFINGIRFYRLLFMIGASFLGIIGLLVIGLIFLTKLASTKSFGKPYLMPFVPINLNGLKNSIIKKPLPNLIKKGKNYYNSKI